MLKTTVTTVTKTFTLPLFLALLGCTINLGDTIPKGHFVFQKIVKNNNHFILSFFSDIDYRRYLPVNSVSCLIKKDKTISHTDFDNQHIERPIKTVLTSSQLNLLHGKEANYPKVKEQGGKFYYSIQLHHDGDGQLKQVLLSADTDLTCAIIQPNGSTNTKRYISSSIIVPQKALLKVLE